MWAVISEKLLGEKHTACKDNRYVITLSPGTGHFFSQTPWAMSWMIGVLGFDPRQGLGIFLFTTTSRTALGPTEPPIK
jgi:hypothetical protein